ncbi:hypothetical protein [Terrimonas pollutisoli]|uniref:hypothetical protein n=1 Tax=Terrimonas pollutisoli TaxID=3034147 RepID=UPI0023EE2782|nr:hypothetical protein [Terrimonas sp. H1YJ31]
MKTLLLIHLVLLLLAACSSQDEMQTFIPGTYIRFSQHEYGTEYDTLVITPQNKTANEYKILRKWKYERVLDGSPIEPEYKRLTTSGIYNTKHKLLQETETGDMFSFDVRGKLLFNGPTKYQKL